MNAKLKPNKVAPAYAGSKTFVHTMSTRFCRESTYRKLQELAKMEVRSCTGQIEWMIQEYHKIKIKENTNAG